MIVGSFTPAHIFRGGSPASINSGLPGRIFSLRIRQALIIFQFACAIILIILGLSINRQINYLFARDYDYEPAGLIVVSNPEDENREALGAKLLSGRFFNKEYGAEYSNIIINRTTANNLGYSPKEVISKTVVSHNFAQPLRIIGVIEDIHFFSLHEFSPPMMFNLFKDPSPYSNILIRVDPGNIKQTLPLIEERWKQEQTEFPFVYHILEDRHNSL